MMRKTKKKTKKAINLSSVAKAKTEAEGIKKTKIRVIGIGGGGCSIVSEIAFKMPKASFVVANTDLQALRTSGKRALRFRFGENLTHGLGTGMNVDLGREAALEAKERIKKLLEGQDLCILVVSFGGGAGSGAAPIFAKISKSLGNLTYGIFTMPFKFEGEKKMEIAKASLKKIKNYLNAITIIPNERVFQIIDKDTPLKQALSVINKNLAESLGGLIETIYEPGLINIDFADFRTILEGRGRLVYLNTVEVQRKEGSVKELIEKVLSSPLYPYGIRGAKGVLFNIAGEKNLSLSEVSQISKTISELVNPEAKIIFGISQSQKYSETIKTTLLANGCGMKVFEGEAKKKKIRRIGGRAGEAQKKKREISDKTPPIGKESIPEEKKEKAPTKKKIVRESASSADAPKRRKPEKPEGKKLKIKVIKKEKETAPLLPKEKMPQAQQVSVQSEGGETIRKNALQIKKEIEEIEQEMLKKEQFWETPAFLRKRLAKGK